MSLSAFVSSTVGRGADVVSRSSDSLSNSLRPLPKAGAASADLDDADVVHGKAATIIRDFRAQIRRGNPFTLDMSTISSLVDALRHKNSVDDRKFLLEHILTMLSRLPEQSAMTQSLSNAVVSMLYYDLSHPPATYIDSPAQFRPPVPGVANGHAGPATPPGLPPLGPPNYSWRLPDGSYNSLASPEMGRAGTHYARTVQGRHPVSEKDRPDPGLVFDALLKRDKFVEHPAGLSSLMFAFAALVIHTLFYTNPQDPTINMTNSYVDLSPLYGFTNEAQDGVRRKYHAADRYQHNDTGYSDPGYATRPLGRGLLHEDVFAEDRFLLLPPASAVLLVMFCRNHNYIAGKLLEINERGTYVDPLSLPPPPGGTAPVQASGTTPTAQAAKAGIYTPAAAGMPAAALATLGEDSIVEMLMRQDDDIFNTAKLINCAWFGMIVFSDYFSAILGLVRNGSSWSLDPFEEIREENHTFVGRGEGNACSVEFNHVYHWHAIVSQADEAWTENVFKSIWPDKKASEITPMEFIQGVSKVRANESPDVSTWTFGQLQRGPDGRFNDDQLAKILHDASEHPAGAFRARGTPECLRVVDILGILRSRKWGVCTLNEFRVYFGLRPYKSFEEWNPNAEIAEAAYRLYGHIDNLELYVGLQAEEAKPVIDGAGLCPGYTISRAILGDAIALTRGDRFFTTDLTPFNLTPWGYADCAKDTANPGFGSQLGRLLLRNLPNNFTDNSTYTWFALMTPKSMKTYLTNLGIADEYSFTRPGTSESVESVATYQDVSAVLGGDSNAFSSAYAAPARAIIPGTGFFITFDDPVRNARDQRMVAECLLGDGGLEASAQWFYNTTTRMIKDRSFKLVGGNTRSIDLVRDVLNMVPVHWVASEVGGLSLKTPEHPHKIYLESEMQQMLREIYSYIFLENDPAKRVALERNARHHVQNIVHRIRHNISRAGPGVSFGGLLTSFYNLFTGPVHEPVHKFLHRLYEKSKSDAELANNVLAVVVGSSVELAQGLVNVVNFYLEPKNAEHREKIIALAGSEASENIALLEGYVREALRLDPPLPGPIRKVKHDVNIGSQHLPAGSQLFVNIAAACQDSVAFSNPTVVQPTRPKDQYGVLGDGVHKILGQDFVGKTMAQVLKAVFQLKNLRRVPGNSGVLKRFPYDSHGQTHYEYLDQHQMLVPWANSMVVQYDE